MEMNEVRVLNDLFETEPVDHLMRSLWRPWRTEGLERVAPQIRIDLSEDDAAYTLKAEIPGLKKDDIDVRVDGRQVTLSAEVKQERDEKRDGGRILRSERRFGYASRSFTLDRAVDEGRAEAQYRDGVLELRLPKKSGAEAGRKVAIAG
jgi:HSP20 family protein